MNRKNLVEATAEPWRPPLMSVENNAWRKFLGFVRRALDLQAGSVWADLSGELAGVSGKVLDVGCGAQPYRCLLPPGTEYRGIDTADATAHFGYEAPDTTYYSGDTWPVESESFDVVLCTETLEHVLKPLPFLREARRCLRTGGRLVATVPFAARWHFIPYDYWRYTPSSLQHLLEGSGFDNVSVYARGNAVTVACYKVMALILPFFFPQTRSLAVRLGSGLVGAALSPILGFCAIVANLSLLWPGGNDCLGYTVTARAGRVAETTDR